MRGVIELQRGEAMSKTVIDCPTVLPLTSGCE